jgi:hypothetical protein
MCVEQSISPTTQLGTDLKSDFRKRMASYSQIKSLVQTLIPL